MGWAGWWSGVAEGVETRASKMGERREAARSHTSTCKTLLATHLLEAQACRRVDGAVDRDVSLCTHMSRARGRGILRQPVLAADPGLLAAMRTGGDT